MLDPFPTKHYLRAGGDESSLQNEKSAVPQDFFGDYSAIIMSRDHGGPHYHGNEVTA